MSIGRGKHRDRRITEFDGIRTTGRIGVSQLKIPLHAGVAVDGTWTVAVTATGLMTVTRTTGNNTVHEFVTYLELAAAHVIPISYDVVYTCNLADSGDDIQFHLGKIIVPANGAAQQAMTVLAGATDAHYDADHDTAAERVVDTAGPELHTATITVPTASQIPLAVDEQLIFLIEATEADDATAALALVVQQAVLTYRFQAL